MAEHQAGQAGGADPQAYLVSMCVMSHTQLLNLMNPPLYCSHYDVGPQTLENHKRIKRYEAILRRLGVPIRPIRAYSNETLYFYFEAINLLDTYEHPSAIPIKDDADDGEWS